MKPPGSCLAHVRQLRAELRRGYTLVEILVATVLTLIMMYAVVSIFGMIGKSVTASRATLEMSDRLRATETTLERDLAAVTVTMLPPRRLESAEGYFEYVEGPIGPVIAPWVVAKNLDRNSIILPGEKEEDSSVGDIDDILMFTVCSPDKPFVGRARFKRAPGADPADGTDQFGDFVYEDRIVESQTAEVIWFVRGRTLYRRVLLVLPGFDFDLRLPGLGTTDREGFYAYNDVSIHQEWVDLDWLQDPASNPPQVPNTPWLVPNTMADLTKPECRFGHHPDTAAVFPSHPHQTQPWGRVVLGGQWHLGLRLPTLCECSSDPQPGAGPPTTQSWIAGDPLPTPPLTDAGKDFDAWVDPYPFADPDPAIPTAGLDPDTGAHSYYYNPDDPNNANAHTQRIAEDVILTNVISFNVEAWDPGAPIVVVRDKSSGDPVVPELALMPADAGYLAELQYAYANAKAPTAYGAYADLNYMCLLGPENPADPPALQVPDYRPPSGRPEPQFHWAGDRRSGLRGTPPFLKDFTDPASPWPSTRLASIYDTWSFHYEHDGRRWVFDRNGNGTEDPNEVAGDQDGDGRYDEGTDGLDNGGIAGIVDDPDEMETSPPYPQPLRGIQVKIRCFEPDSRQIREVTVVQDFLPK